MATDNNTTPDTPEQDPSQLDLFQAEEQAPKSPTEGWTDEDWDAYYEASARSHEGNMER